MLENIEKRQIEVGYFGEIKSPLFSTIVKKDITWLKTCFLYAKKERFHIIAFDEMDIKPIISEYLNKIVEDSDKIVLQYEQEFDTIYHIIQKNRLKIILCSKQKELGSHVKQKQEKLIFCDTAHITDEIVFQKVNENKIQDVILIFYGKRANLFAKKYQNYLDKYPHIRALEAEWAKYKYEVLEHSQQHYNAIRKLLKDKSKYPVELFYQYLEEAMSLPIQNEVAINAIDHVWGYFKEKATQEEKKTYIGLKKGYEEKRVMLIEVKKYLWRLTVKYKEAYLYESSYFFDCYE